MTTEVSPKKPTKAKAKSVSKAPAHPPYLEMVLAAVTELKERSGSSRQAICKYIEANFKDTKRPHINTAIKRGVTQAKLLQPKGTGASGSFKITKEKVVAPKKKPAAKTKKVTAKKPAKKTVKKPKATTTPKKSSKKPKPASVKKSATKKPAVKKAPTKTKKPAVKKPVKSVKKKTPAKKGKK